MAVLHMLHSARPSIIDSVLPNPNTETALEEDGGIAHSADYAMASRFSFSLYKKIVSIYFTLICSAIIAEFRISNCLLIGYWP